jgi:CelD/BcsL family acetyltransferase involved in cellulose biosynthesis
LTLSASTKSRELSIGTSLGMRTVVMAKLLPQVIKIVSTVDDFHKIEDDWRKLEIENLGRSTVFQSYDWIKAWCDAYLQPEAKSEIFILTGYQGVKLVFALPLIKSRKAALTVLDWLTDPIGQYGDALCAKSESLQSWLAAAFDQIRKTKGIDLVRLRHVRDTSTIADYAKQHMQDAKYYERAPYLDLAAFKSESDYDARYTSTQRKRRKKIRKSLEDMGPVSFEVIPAGVACERAIEQSIVEKNAWLSDRGRFNRVMGCTRHVEFLKSLSRISNTKFRAVTTELKAGGKPVSWEIGFRYNGTHFAYITSHVNALTDLSPGRLHMDLSQRQALADGQTVFDLMVPYDVHKESWSSGTIPTNDYFHPITAKGWIYGQGYLKTLRPLIRKLYYSLPPKILRLLQPITRH